MTETPDITQLVNAWRQGDASALDQLAPFVYEELKRLARTQMRSESPGHTLQATALVNEAFLRLHHHPRAIAAVVAAASVGCSSADCC